MLGILHITAASAEPPVEQSEDACSPAARRPRQEIRSHCLPGEGRLISPEPFEDRIVEVGEPLETQGQLPS